MTGRIASILGGNGCGTGPHVSSNPHVPRTWHTMGARLLSLVPQRGRIPSIWGGGGWCITGPHVSSNPMHHRHPPRAKYMAHDWSAPLVVGPQEGTYCIHLGVGIGAARAHMCPLAPCITPTLHVPRTWRTMGARLLSLVPWRGRIPSLSGGGSVQHGPTCVLSPHASPVPPTCQGHGAKWERASCPWFPRGEVFHPFRGGGCSTGPHVSSNPMHHRNAPRAKDTTKQGSAPLVFPPRHTQLCTP